ncbi:MAG: SdpI family protein [Lentisphaeria bacterium]|nr:SdpI family protein [Lentisphaeria bacterium]
MKEKSQHIKELDPASGECCNTQHCCRTPWISKVFDILGVIFIASGIVMLVSSIFTETTALFMVFFISLFGTGFIYSAIAELLRSNAEIAFNTRAMLAIKRHEHEKYHSDTE